MSEEESSDELRADQAELRRLSELTGYRAILSDVAGQLNLIGIAIQNADREGDDLMSVGTVLRENAAAVKAANEALNTAIDAAIARLSDNASQADIDAAMTDLTSAKDTATAALSKVEAEIDPAQPGGGVIVDPADPEDVVPA